MTEIIAFVGLPGSGKSVAARVLAEKGYAIIRLGDITEQELQKRGLPINEENEATVREELRRVHGMDAYAKLNLPRIKENAKTIIDGLRSIEEYKLFKTEFGKAFRLVAIDSPPEIRYKRMAKRKVRSLTEKECLARDRRELDILGVGNTLAVATEWIDNSGNMEKFIQDVNNLI